MITPEKRPPRNFNFFKTAKTIFWSFLLGAGVGAVGGGYAVLNADRLNLPIANRGSNSTQGTISKENSGQEKQAQTETPSNTETNKGNQASPTPVGTSNSNAIGNTSAADTAAGAVKTDIKITPQDPKFQNDKLPGYFAQQGFASKPPQLSDFKGANVFTRDLVVAGQANFSSDNVVVRGKSYAPVFYLEGSNREVKRVAFKLNGKQKAALLQMGVPDLSAGDTNLIYQVDVSADGNKVWSGRVIYGSNQQILSVPISIPEATTLVIEHKISQGGDPRLNLVLTRAELLY
jgi:hypothetical protein